VPGKDGPNAAEGERLIGDADDEAAITRRTFARASAGVAFGSFSLAGCVASGTGGSTVPGTAGAGEIDGFTRCRFAAGGIEHDVFHKGKGPVVLLMHELNGMSPACIGLAEELAGEGFAVYMPLLFGRPGDDEGFGFVPQICVTREIRLFANDGGSPISGWLAALSRAAQRREAKAQGKPPEEITVGVIGMCLTGNFALCLIAEPMVRAAVASQPALPLKPFGKARASLALTKDELDRAQARSAAGVPLLCLRFSEDQVSPPERMEAIRRSFPQDVEVIEIDSGPGNPDWLPAHSHSVLTGSFSGKAGHPTRRARTRVITFLKEHLCRAGCAAAS
jgi:dienelactone hydrolase